MSDCQACGRPAENGTPVHWIGCDEAAGRDLLGPLVEGLTLVPPSVSLCEHGECSEPKKEYAGRGAKPKYCEEHSDPKNRK
jgi:hypothetical protein